MPDDALTLRSFTVRDVQFGGADRLDGGVLTIDREGARRELLADARLAEANLDLARPGEPVRIVHALDVIEPRCKADGSPCFPGYLGPPLPAGEGATNRLAGVAVLAIASFPDVTASLGSAKEAVVDMSGPAADFSPFSRTCNVTLELRRAPGVSAVEFNSAVRLAGLRLAHRLARASLGCAPQAEGPVPRLAGRTAPAGLPRVALLCQLGCEGGMLGNTHLYGHSFEGMVPTLVTPAELADGAVVCNRFHYGCQRNPTYYHQNNPLVAELLAADGQRLHFAGIVIYRGYNPAGFFKQRSATISAQLARVLGADAAIVTTEGGGNSHMDTMLTCQACERHGIRTVVVLSEMAGPRSDDPGLIDYVPEATSIVTAGNREELVELPAVERVIGGGELWGETPLQPSGDAARGPVTRPVRDFYCATNMLGAHNLTLVSD